MSTKLRRAGIRAAADAARIDDQHGRTPRQLRTALVVEADVMGTRNGRAVDGTRSSRLPVGPGDGVYPVDDPATVTESGTHTTQLSAPATHA
ncbi:DUF5305 family protein [Halorhabdus salina]|uniref:DUF5305 family protein n=1 Tax=Halorhabdus salina TaxID=2750670 RepID=UPI0015EF6868|nr:hypothetical protein [Halorhabdus salina]